MKLSSLENALCNMQGKLFEMSLDQGMDSSEFIRLFMQSDSAKGLDMPFHYLQWAGAKYIMEDLEDTVHPPQAGIQYSRDQMYWIGYLYRFWHFYTGQTSREIYEIADEALLARCYPGYHTLDPAMAVDRLLESRGLLKEDKDSSVMV